MSGYLKVNITDKEIAENSFKIALKLDVIISIFKMAIDFVNRSSDFILKEKELVYEVFKVFQYFKKLLVMELNKFMHGLICQNFEFVDYLIENR